MNQEELEISWQNLDVSTQKVACLLSLFVAHPFEWNLIEECLLNDDRDELEDILNHLLDIGLLEEIDEDIYLEEDLYSLMVTENFHDFLRDKLENSDFAKQLKQNFSHKIISVGKKLTEEPTVAKIEIFKHNIPHLELVVTELLDYIQDEDLISPFISLGKFYQFQGEYESAISLLEAGLIAAKDKLGTEHPGVATIFDNLANIFSIQGDYHQAEKIYQQALKIRQKLQDKNIVDISVSLINLAQIYKLQERYGDAETFFRVALAQRKNRLGEKHLDVATTINDIGTVLVVQKRYYEAESLLIEALEIRKQLSGDRSLQVADSFNDLGQLYYCQERYDKAEQLLAEALEIQKKLLGSEHSHVVSSLNNLATVYQSQEFYQQAKALYAEAMEISETVLGEEHPKTQAISNNLKLCLYDLEEKSTCFLNNELILYQPNGDYLTIKTSKLTVEVNKKSVIRCALSFQVSPQIYQDITYKELFHLETQMQLYTIGDGFEVNRDVEIQAELSSDLLFDLSLYAKTPLEVANYLLDLNSKQSQLPILNTENWYATSIGQWVPLDTDLGEDTLIKTDYNTNWTIANKIKLQLMGT
ncbi:MAG: tetratricopeptide repeat protein [Cyanobacteria bacterium J06633_8]